MAGWRPVRFICAMWWPRAPLPSLPSLPGHEALGAGASGRRAVYQRLKASYGPTYLTILSVIQAVAMGDLAQVVAGSYQDFTLVQWVLTLNTFSVQSALWGWLRYDLALIVPLASRLGSVDAGRRLAICYLLIVRATRVWSPRQESPPPRAGPHQRCGRGSSYSRRQTRRRCLSSVSPSRIASCIAKEHRPCALGVVY
jgi:hypothetical protein